MKEDWPLLSGTLELLLRSARERADTRLKRSPAATVPTVRLCDAMLTTLRLAPHGSRDPAARRGRYRISLREHKVYEVGEALRYCSDECAAVMRRLHGALLTVAAATVDPTFAAKAAASHGPRSGQGQAGATGNGQVVMRSHIRERDTSTAAAAAAAAAVVAPEPTAVAVEGYVPAARKKDGRRVKFSDEVDSQAARVPSSVTGAAPPVDADRASTGVRSPATAAATTAPTAPVASTVAPPVLEFAIMNLTQAEMERSRGLAGDGMEGMLRVLPADAGAPAAPVTGSAPQLTGVHPAHFGAFKVSPVGASQCHSHQHRSAP
jgi:hypothetical protein